jgi:hypothetical protein
MTWHRIIHPPIIGRNQTQKQLRRRDRHISPASQAATINRANQIVAKVLENTRREFGGAGLVLHGVVDIVVLRSRRTIRGLNGKRLRMDTRKMRELKRERVKIALRTCASDKHFTSVQNPSFYVGTCRNSYQNVYQMFIRSFTPQHKIVATMANRPPASFFYERPPFQAAAIPSGRSDAHQSTGWRRLWVAPGLSSGHFAAVGP